MDKKNYFKNENTFIILGHGDNYNPDRFELKQNQYGAIPTKCGEGLLAKAYIHTVNTASSLPNIPIPSHNVSLRNVSYSIPFDFSGKKNITFNSRLRGFQIYRPPRTNNTIRSSAIYTMPNINVSLFSYWLYPDSLFQDYMLLQLAKSGVVPILKTDFHNNNISVKKSDLYKPITLLLKDKDYILVFNFIKECFNDSIIPFRDLMTIPLINEYKVNHLLNKTDTDFSIFMKLKNDKELRDLYYDVIKNFSIMDILKISLPLQFIYEYISNNVVKTEPFLVISRLCRPQSKAITRRNQAKQRRKSINNRKDPLYNMNNPQNPNNNNNDENPINTYMSSTEDPRQPVLYNSNLNDPQSVGGRRITRRRRVKP
jgi:hypothetical protein